MPFQRGAPKGNRNRYRHGLYSKVVMERRTAIRERREAVRIILQRMTIILRLHEALARKNARIRGPRPLRRARPAMRFRQRPRPHWAAAIRNSWRPQRFLGITFGIDPKTVPPPQDDPPLRELREEDLHTNPREFSQTFSVWLDCLGDIGHAQQAVELGWSIDAVMKAVAKITAEEREARRRAWHTAKPLAPPAEWRTNKLYFRKRLFELLQENALLESPSPPPGERAG
jgi:hypothetical protein